MQGNVLDIGTKDLAMGTADAHLLFEGAHIDLTETEIDDLVLRTEGWPGGLHFAALALDPEHGVHSFSGRDRLVGEYLIEEVLDVTSPDTVQFLERSATLEYMDAGLLDLFLGAVGQRRAAGNDRIVRQPVPRAPRQRGPPLPLSPPVPGPAPPATPDT